MASAEAARLLELPENATPEQLESRFLELRRKLEDKIARAPTPGLQAKYRESLTAITTAFETLMLAADSSTLPVLDKPSAVSGQPSVGAPSSREAVSLSSPAHPADSTRSSPKKRTGGNEFLVVAVIAVVVLGGGAWWVMKTRAEKAEEKRVAAEARAEADRVAEAKRKADEAERARMAAEKVRRTSQLRTELATARVAWEAIEKQLQAAERQASETKGELRGFRDGPAWKKAELSAMVKRQEMLTAWLTGELAEHPAKIARVTAEQLGNDGLLDEAEEAVAQMRDALGALQDAMRQRTSELLEATAELVIESKPAGVKFTYTDAYGRKTEGVTPAVLRDQPLSHLHDPKYDGFAGDTAVKLGEFSVEPSVRFTRPGWKEVVVVGRIGADGAHFSAEFPEGALEIKSDPAGLKFTITQHEDLGWTKTGTTPATITGVPVGRVKVLVERPGYGTSHQNLDIVAGQTLKTLPLTVVGQDATITVAEAKAKIFVDRKFAGHGKVTVRDLAPGEHALQLEAEGYTPYRAKFSVGLGPGKPVSLSYNFKDLSAERHTCRNCKGAGAFNRSETCYTCRGSGRIKCYDCPGNGIAGYVTGDYGGGVMGQKMVRCSTCEGKGKLPCDGGCNNGTRYWKDSCTMCGGDGRASLLQMSE